MSTTQITEETQYDQGDVPSGLLWQMADSLGQRLQERMVSRAQRNDGAQVVVCDVSKAFDVVDVKASLGLAADRTAMIPVREELVSA